MEKSGSELIIYKLEVLNSLAWFGMDALWMMEHHKLAYIFGIPTLVTAIMTIYHSRTKCDKMINFSILFWIMMNISWLLSEIYPFIKQAHLTTTFFICGISSIGIALYFSDSVFETMRKLKRMRLITPLREKPQIVINKKDQL